jgi:hypothetical protein
MEVNRQNNVTHIRLIDSLMNEEIENLHRRRLFDCFFSLKSQKSLQEGQIVRWKAGMKNRNYPEYGEEVIVTEVLENPLIDHTERESGSPYFREPLSIKIGEFVEGDFVEFHVDGRRFEIC